MKNENKKKVYGAGLMALALALVGFGGYSFAKYITAADNGDESATVAKFGISVEFDEGALFDNVYFAGEEVKAGALTLAPGTSGERAYTITDSGREVDVKVTYEFEVTYSSEWGTYNPLEVYVTAGADELSFTDGEFSKDYKVGSTIPSGTVGWSWAFDGDDEEDTRMGLTGGTVTISLGITVEQIQPVKA